MAGGITAFTVPVAEDTTVAAATTADEAMAAVAMAVEAAMAEVAVMAEVAMEPVVVGSVGEAAVGEADSMEAAVAMEAVVVMVAAVVTANLQQMQYGGASTAPPYCFYSSRTTLNSP